MMSLLKLNLRKSKKNVGISVQEAALLLIMFLSRFNLSYCTYTCVYKQNMSKNSYFSIIIAIGAVFPHAYRAYKIGDDVEFSVKANASGRSTRTVRLSINTKAVNYIGVAKSSIRKSTATMKVTPGT